MTHVGLTAVILVLTVPAGTDLGVDLDRTRIDADNLRKRSPGLR